MAYLLTNPLITANPSKRPKGLYRLYGKLNAHQRNFGHPVLRNLAPKKAAISAVNLPISVVQHSMPATVNEVAFGVFYRRFISDRTNLFLGFVTADKKIDLKLFNGYFEAKKLRDIRLNNLSGVAVETATGRNDITINPLRTTILKITVSRKGSSKIDGDVELIFDDAPPLTIRITGSHVLLWNIPPNWKNSVRETFMYKTDVITSYNKKEQRRSLITQPRRGIGYDTALSKRLLMSIRNTLYGWHNRPYLMPLWWQVLTLKKSCSRGETILNVSDLSGISNIQESSQLAMWKNPFETELVTVKSVSGNTITLLTPIENNYSAGDEIYPLTDAMLDSNLTIQNLTSEVATSSISASLLGESVPLGRLQKDSHKIVMFNGIEVLSERPNWQSSTEDVYDSDIEIVNFGYGGVVYFDRGTPTLLTRTATFLSKTRQQTEWWRRFIHRQRGQLKSFFVPTNTKDVTLAKDANNGAKEFLMDDYYLSSIVNNSKERKILGIRIYGKDYFFTIEKIDVLDDLARVVVKEEIPFFMPKKDVTFINFLQRMRFASDEVEIEHITSEVAQLTLKFKQVKELK